MLKLPFTCTEQWGGNGSHTVVESQPDHPTPTPRASVTECLSTGGSSEVQYVLAWLTAFLPHITSIHFATFAAFELAWPPILSSPASLLSC